MKRIFFVLSVLFLLSLISACKESPVEEYGDALIDSYEMSKEAADAANLDTIKRSIAAYYASNGKYPESLDEIAAFTGIELNPDKYDYDPETGKITLR
jgi:hypothetical protein